MKQSFTATKEGEILKFKLTLNSKYLLHKFLLVDDKSERHFNAITVFKTTY